MQLPVIIITLLVTIMTGGIGYVGYSEYQKSQIEKEFEIQALKEEVQELKRDQDEEEVQQLQVNEEVVTKPEVRIIEKIVEVPVVKPSPKIDQPVEEKIINTVKNVSVDIVTYNTFSETTGYDQLPATVGYRLSNSSKEDIIIDSFEFFIDKHGGHIITPDMTSYSITKEIGAKEPAYYFKNYGGTLNRYLQDSLEIPAEGSLTVFFNMWNIGGKVYREHQSTDKHTLVVLKGVTSLTENVKFDLGPSKEISVKIPHID